MSEVPDQVKEAILMWLKSFSLAEGSVKGFADLGDGIVLEQVLHQVSPIHFAYASSDRDARSDWVLASHHVSSMLESMLAYFEEVFKKTIDISDIDPASITRERNVASILKWIQLVVGAVVMCSQKELFIKRILAKIVSTYKSNPYLKDSREYNSEERPLVRPSNAMKSIVMSETFNIK